MRACHQASRAEDPVAALLRDPLMDVGHVAERLASRLLNIFQHVLVPSEFASFFGRFQSKGRRHDAKKLGAATPSIARMLLGLPPGAADGEGVHGAAQGGGGRVRSDRRAQDENGLEPDEGGGVSERAVEGWGRGRGYRAVSVTSSHLVFHT